MGCVRIELKPQVEMQPELNPALKPFGTTSKEKTGGLDGVHEYLIALYSFGDASGYEIRTAPGCSREVTLAVITQRAIGTGCCNLFPLQGDVRKGRFNSVEMRMGERIVPPCR